MTDLERRVKSRKHDLISEVIEHKKNSSRGLATLEIERITAHLTELAAMHVDWSNVEPGTRVRLDAWLAR